jgi:heme/copper-type cytochrome/quinol oxidase subunit 2
MTTTKYTLGLALGIIAIAAMWFSFSGSWGTGGSSAPAAPSLRPMVSGEYDVPSHEPISKPPEGGVIAPAFSAAVPADAALSAPQTEARAGDAAKGSAVKVFDIQASQAGISPASIVVSKGDRVQFNFTATDNKYDLAIAAPVGAYVTAGKGESTSLSFTVATVGTYEFACQSFCPMGNRVAGSLIVQ